MLSPTDTDSRADAESSKRRRKKHASRATAIGGNRDPIKKISSRPFITGAASDMHERLKLLRISAGLPTATEAAKAMGVPKGSYCQHESGIRPISLSSAERYATFYKRPIGFILYGIEAAENGRVPITGILGFQGVVEAVPPTSTLPRALRAPDPAIAGLSALVITGDELWPAYRAGDCVFYEDLDDQALRAKHVDNRECVVTFEDGSKRVLLIVHQRDGSWTGHPISGPPLMNLKIRHASPVRFIERDAIRRNGELDQLARQT